MQSERIGAEITLARTTLAMSAERVAARAGVSSSTVWRIEHGEPGLTLNSICAVAEAVGLDLVLRVYPGTPPSLRDTGQLELAELIVTRAAPTWQPTVELLVGQHGESIDLALFGSLEVWAVEIERMATDFQAQYRRADQKRETLAAGHQRPTRLVMVVEDSRQNRRVLAAHRDLIGRALPAGSREVFRALERGLPLGRDGLLWVRRPRRARRDGPMPAGSTR